MEEVRKYFCGGFTPIAIRTFFDAIEAAKAGTVPQTANIKTPAAVPCDILETTSKSPYAT